MMNLNIIKCNDCSHVAVCSKKEQYKKLCERITDAAGYAENCLADINVRCRHHTPIISSIRG